MSRYERRSLYEFNLDLIRGLFQFGLMTMAGMAMVVWYFTGLTLAQQMRPFLLLLVMVIQGLEAAHVYIQTTPGAGPTVLGGLVLGVLLLLVVSRRRTAHVAAVGLFLLMFFRILPVVVAAILILTALSKGAH